MILTITLVSPSPPLTPVRPPWWPLLLLLVLGVVGLWAFDTRQPATWPEAATPWFTHVRALAPSAWIVDHVNARAALTPDLPLASLLVVLAVAACTLVTLLAAGVRSSMAIAVALGLVATRSLWSTVSPGHDALPVAVVACAVAAAALPNARRGVTGAVAVGALLVAPSASWLAVPAVAAAPMSWRHRGLLAAAWILLSLALEAALLRQMWGGISCLAPGEWPTALGEVLRPGSSADASPWLALRQATAVLGGDVHAFGVCVAILGLARSSARMRPLRLATAMAAGVAGLVVATGALPPGFTAALLLPWWAAWFGQGLAVLISNTAGRAGSLAAGLGVVLALATPVLRHATVVPDPWTAGMPAVTQAVAGTWNGGSVASDDEALTRRLRLAGTAMVPVSVGALDRCVASGRPVYALGATVSRVEHLGYHLVERPLRAPLAAVLRDLRPDQLVALALAPSALAWAGPGGMAAIARLTPIRAYVQSSPALGIVGRTDRGGLVRTGREGIDLSLPEGETVGGRQLFDPVAVSARQGEALVDSASERLVAGGQAALAVRDRAHSLRLRTVSAPAPGLPMSLVRQPDWRLVQVEGTAACVAPSRRWTPMPRSTRRLSVPTAGASPARPVLLYLASATLPAVGVAGLAAPSRGRAWSVDLFDTQDAAQTSRLHALETQDEVPAALRVRARWVARVVVAPRGAWEADRVAVSAGTAPEAWVLRIAAEGRHGATSVPCAMAAAGDRLLQGHYGPMDDDSAHELAVTSVDGWHAAESLHGQVSQWTARPVATAAFRVEASMPLTLALDATATGAQPILVRLNDRVLETDWQGAGRIPIPADAVRAGTNTLSLEVGQVGQGDGDTRALGIQIRQLRVIHRR
jgi:hypothetical protein